MSIFNPLSAKRDLNKSEMIAFQAISKSRMPFMMLADNSKRISINGHGYSPDFIITKREYSPNQLIVEVDGMSHFKPKVEQRDSRLHEDVEAQNKQRMEDIHQFGQTDLIHYEYMHFSDDLVLNDPKGFAQCIKNFARSKKIK